jgi:hypothetical protein
MTDTDYDYDLRQIDLMASQISRFETGDVSQSQLINDLDSLLSCLKTVDQNWKNSFKSEWWTLEQVHAVALDRKQASLPPDSKALLTEALGNLKKLILNAKGVLLRKRA